MGRISMARSSLAKPWLRMMASVLAIRLPWVTMAKRGMPVEPDVAISAARSDAARAAGAIIARDSLANSPCSQRTRLLSISPARGDVSVHTTLAPVTSNNLAAESLTWRSSTGTATSPAYIVPKYTNADEGDREQPIRTRSPLRRPEDSKWAPTAAIRRGKSSGEIMCCVAASIKQELGPTRSTNRPAKFHSAGAVNLPLLNYEF